MTKWEKTSIVRDNEAFKKEGTTAVIKKTDTTKGDRLPCDHFRVHTTTDEISKEKHATNSNQQSKMKPL